MEPEGGNPRIVVAIHNFIDKALGVGQIGTTSPHSRHIESCQQLSGKQPDNFRGVDFIREIYKVIVDNCASKASAKDFRWEPHPNLSVGKSGKGHTGAEVPFERALVILSELKHGYGPGSWTNQVPVASGLVDGAGQNAGKPARVGVRAIDLIHRAADGTSYDFIELKMPPEKGGETPLYAAIELLIYGLLYVFSRTLLEHPQKNRQDGLPQKLEKSADEGLLSNATKRVNLYVVAPEKFYASKHGEYDLSWLELALDCGLGEFLKTDHPSLGLKMHFRFEKFANKFLEDDSVSGHGLNLRFEPRPVYSK
jgi:hypothetical protein